MINIAVILAGGLGRRIGGEKPKQFLPLKDGRSILEHSVEAFEQAEFIDEICIVMHPDFIAEAERLRDKNAWQKVRAIIPGGDERWRSSYNAIMYYTKRLVFTLNHQLNEDRPYPELPTYSEARDINLWFHDAARPFVSQRILSDINELLRKGRSAVTVAVHATETEYLFNHPKDGETYPSVQIVLDRNNLMHAQTPQVFCMADIAQPYMRLAEDPHRTFVPTDDVSVFMHQYGGANIPIVLGDESNRKITYKEDL